MKVRSNHIGGWRFRLKIMPWGSIAAGGFLVFTILCALAIAAVIVLHGSTQ